MYSCVEHDPIRDDWLGNGVLQHKRGIVNIIQLWTATVVSPLQQISCRSESEIMIDSRSLTIPTIPRFLIEHVRGTYLQLKSNMETVKCWLMNLLCKVLQPTVLESNRAEIFSKTRQNAREAESHGFGSLVTFGYCSTEQPKLLMVFR